MRSKLGCFSLCILGLGSLSASPQQDTAQDLEKTIRQLRELRTRYYERKRDHQRRIADARAAAEKLQQEIDDLSDQDRRLRNDLSQIQEEIASLEERLGNLNGRQQSLQEALGAFAERARRHIEAGMPYRQVARRSAADSIAPSDSPTSEGFGRAWSFVQDELRIARSGETYTEEAGLSDGRRKHARYLRVGKLVLAFVTEDGVETGLWVPDRGWVTELTRENAEAVRTAVEILDRRRTPEWVLLPVRIGKTGSR